MSRSQRTQDIFQSHRTELIELYPTTNNEILCQRFGVSLSTLQRWARHLNLQKSIEHRSIIQRERALNRRLSNQTRAKIAAQAKGQRVSDAAKLKQLQTKLRNDTIRRGERHHNWKGGRPWERFKNPQYLAWRKAVLQRDDYICQQCGRQCKKHERGLAAHHIKPYATFPELRYELSNGITLCRACHMSLHGKLSVPKERIVCACGCGILIDPVDIYGRPRLYVNYHGRRGQRQPESMKILLSEQRIGKALTAEHRAKISEGLQRSNKRVGRPPKNST